MRNTKRRKDQTQVDDQSEKIISRRDFIKYGIGAAAVAAGASTVMGKLSLPIEDAGQSTPARNSSQEPIVATVNGDQVIVMNGQSSVKVDDRDLAARIAEKLERGN